MPDQGYGLSTLIFLPIAGAVAALLLPRGAARALALAVSLATLALASVLAWSYPREGSSPTAAEVFSARVAEIERARTADPEAKAEARELRAALANPQCAHLKLVEHRPWIRAFRIHYLLAADGLSLPLVWLTALLTPLCLLLSWRIEKLPSAFFALFLLLEGALVGVFVALDLFLFYVFWELVLLPMYLLIGIWGGPRRIYAAVKFFIYTLLGSVLMLVAFLYMHFQTDPRSWNLLAIETVVRDPLIVSLGAQRWLFLALFVGFAVKVPAFPFHTWLPDAHVEAPTGASMVLAGVLLKMGVYGFFRFLYPLFPEVATSPSVVWFIAVIGMVNVVYGSLVAMAQTDFKALVAYSSIGAMGYCLLGVAAQTAGGATGAALQAWNHGIESPLLFGLVGVVYDRVRHRNLSEMGGLASVMPHTAALATVGFFAALGLPGLNMFVGEALTLLGAYVPESLIAGGTRAFPGIGARWIVYASLSGIVLTAAYVLWTVQRVFLGPLRAEHVQLPDLDAREALALAPLAALCVVLGVFPHLLIDYMAPSLDAILRFTLAAGAGR
jgi:NADH-quinone oxidoreductase subunit M